MELETVFEYDILGIVFSRTDPNVGWLADSIKQIQLYTDVQFHYFGDGTDNGSKGGSVPPLYKWTTQPSNLYRYYDKTRVSAFTRGCEWNNGDCGTSYKSNWALDQIFFNLGSCDESCEQLYDDTFNNIPTKLVNWTPNTGLINTGTYFTLFHIFHFYFLVFTRSVLRSNSVTESFDELIRELDSVMDDIMKIVKFNKCMIPEGACKIPAECVRSINGKKCECNNLDTEIELKCNCACP